MVTLLPYSVLHAWNAEAYSDENSVCPSVCPRLYDTRPCDKRVHCDRFVCPDFIPCERLLSLVFWKEEWWQATPSTWNFGSNGPRWREIADFEPIFARNSASSVTPREKSSIINNNRKTTRFPVSLRWSSYVAPKPLPPTGTQKRKKALFRLKSHFACRKFATKFLSVKTVSDKVVRHSLA